MKRSLSVLTVLGKDRPGIIAGVTGALFNAGCNLEDISMTVLEGEFAMIMVVCLAPEIKKKLKISFEKLGPKDGLDFFWKDLGGNPRRGNGQPQGTKTFLVSAIGRDRTGIVFKVSRLLSGFGINIRDLNSRILGKGAKTLYAMVLEADIPSRIKISKVGKSLKALERSLKIEITLRPFERIEF